MAAISVLMSLYVKERPEYLRQSLTSIFRQTLLPDEIVVVLDGPITKALQAVLDDFSRQTQRLHVLPQAINRGLGKSLAVGVEACQYELIARMDTDDIAEPTRLAEQYSEFIADSELVICGTNIAEFDGNIDHVIGRRHLPENDAEIRAFSKRRNPFNHMTVMFKRQAVLDAGNYQPMAGFEDYYLWARMLRLGGKTHNIQRDLVFARTGANMYARRGGLKYLVPGLKGRWAIYRVGLGSLFDLLFVSAVHVVVSIMPNRLRGWFYETKLRS